MQHNGLREKRKTRIYILNIILLTLMHVSLTLGHSLDSLTAKHGRSKLASA